MTVANFTTAKKSANDSAEKMRILIADDDSDSLHFIADTVGGLGHIAVTAGNGREALDILGREGPQIDVILLDRIMPYMDGAAVWRFIARDPVLRQIPVIMQTNAGDRADGGADGDSFFYTLAKPYDALVLQSVLNAAIRQAQQGKRLGRRVGQHQAGFALLSSAKFHFRTLEDAEALACFIANCFPEPEHVVTGLAELMINAIEHGNLRIGEKEKEELLKRGAWLAEVRRRLEDPAYAGLEAEVALTRRDGGIYVIITDQGEGFAWQNYIRIDPERATRASGRGIAHAATVCFDTLRYDHVGSKAIAFVREGRPLAW